MTINFLRGPIHCLMSCHGTQPMKFLTEHNKEIKDNKRFVISYSIAERIEVISSEITLAVSSWLPIIIPAGLFGGLFSLGFNKRKLKLLR